METAISCIKEIFPNSHVTANGINKYPIQVIVTATLSKQTVEIWKGRQQDLFRKNAARRKQSMAEITRNLREYADDVVNN